MTTTPTPTDLPEALRLALRRAYNYGQTYWRQADSESFSQQRKSDETAEKFDQFVTETIAALTAPAPTEAAVKDSLSNAQPQAGASVELTDEQLAEKLAESDCEPGAAWRYAGDSEKAIWIKVAQRARALLRGPTPQAGAESYPAEPTPDELRAIAREARNSSGSASDDCGPAAYVLHGWRAATAALRARGAVPSDARTDALCDSAYIAGAKAGYNIGVDEDAAGLGRIIEARKGHLAVLAAPAAPMSAQAPSDAPFQQRVQPWMQACFGPAISADREERNHRFLEEALELVQATGCTSSEAHQLVDYVYGRPVGEPVQEVGGVMVTMAALCLANGLDMHTAAETELARIWTKVEAIRAKQAAKPKHSPLPEAAAPQPPAALPGGQDAARYRWLRGEADRDHVEFADRWIESAEDLDTAIDAAMAAKGRTDGGEPA